jgi:hypothetical protein
MALAMGVGLVPIVDDSDGLRFGFHKGEEGGAAEMPVDPGLQAVLRFGRNAYLHGRISPGKPPRSAVAPFAPSPTASLVRLS